MCAAAISFARIRRLYYGAPDPKGGGVEHGPRIFTQPTCHHAPEVYGGLGEDEAGQLLKAFFAARRKCLALAARGLCAAVSSPRFLGLEGWSSVEISVTGVLGRKLRQRLD